ncbi:MAG: amino acid permease [Spirochaetales bacterium]|nr:amino acid permease [Spirochaetales bacterium]
MPALKQNLKLVHVFSIASGAMISSGIFILPGIAFNMTGPSLFLSYILAGFVAMVGALSIIELATAMPRAGGDYFFIGRTFGPLAGTVTGTLSWLALSLKTAFAIFGLSEIIFALSGIPSSIAALVLTAVFVLINIKGVKETVTLEVILVAGLLLIMAGFIIAGAPAVRRDYFTPFFSNGINGSLSTAAFVFVSFGGLLQVATIAEEVRNPQKNIQRGTILSIVVVTLLYGGIILVTTGLLPAQNFTGSMTPVADAAQIVLGRPGFIIISVAAALAFVTTSIAGLLSASRYPLALSRDNLLPGWVGKISRRSGAPYYSIILTGVVIALALQLNIDILVKSASAVIMLTYIMSNIAVMVLRQSGLSNYKPLYKAPFYPALQIISVLIYIFLIADMGWSAMAGAGIFMAFSVLIYLFYGKNKASHDFALIHLLKNVVDKRWQEEGLEEELMDIIHHRDLNANVRKIFSEMKNFELTEKISSQQLFERIADDTAALGYDRAEVLQGLEEREKSFSTALTPFTAIPHMVIKGDKPLQMLMYRSEKGIFFNEERPAVKAVFALIGNEGQRSHHLHSLAALARIITREDFEKKWAQSSDCEELRLWLTEMSHDS